MDVARLEKPTPALNGTGIGFFNPLLPENGEAAELIARTERKPLGKSLLVWPNRHFAVYAATHYTPQIDRPTRQPPISAAGL